MSRSSRVLTEHSSYNSSWGIVKSRTRCSHNSDAYSIISSTCYLVRSEGLLARVIRVRSGILYCKIFSIVLLPSLYCVIRSSTGILAKPYNWRIASLCLVGISAPGRWSKMRGGVVGGTFNKGWWDGCSLNTRTFRGRLVTYKPCVLARPRINPIHEWHMPVRNTLKCSIFVNGIIRAWARTHAPCNMTCSTACSIPMHQHAKDSCSLLVLIII